MMKHWRPIVCVALVQTKRQLPQSACRAHALGAWLSNCSPLRAASATGFTKRWSTTASPPTKQTRLNIHHEVVIQQKPLPHVFTRIQHEKETKSMRNRYVRNAIDMFFFHCVQQEATLPSAFIDQVLTFFHQELFDPHLNGTNAFVVGSLLNEATIAAAMKLHMIKNNVENAWRIFDQLKYQCTGKLHFRTFAPLLLYECNVNKNYAVAYAKWQELKQRDDMEWNESMEDALVQMALACISHYDETKQPTEQFERELASLLHDLRLASKEISQANVQLLQTAFEAAGYKTTILSSNDKMLPTCSTCNTPLYKETISSDERNQLLSALESRALKIKSDVTAKQFLSPFRDWLLQKNDPTKLHYILDGPNLAYFNQNFHGGRFRFDHVEYVARYLLDQGHCVSITIPFAYLERSTFRIRTRLKEQQRSGQFKFIKRTNEEKQLIAQWTQENLIYSCRTDYLSDDCFWLYASLILGDQARVITNDQGRDHVFALLNHHTNKDKQKKEAISMDLIERWKESIIVNIEFHHQDTTSSIKQPRQMANGSTYYQPTPPAPIEAIELFQPLPFSRVPQLSRPGHFHIPIASEDGKASQWLCASREEA